MIGHQETLLIGAAVALRRQDSHAQMLSVATPCRTGPAAETPAAPAAEGPFEGVQLIAPIKRMIEEMERQSLKTTFQSVKQMWVFTPAVSE